MRGVAFVAVLLLACAAGLAAVAFFWSGATLGSDPSALARLHLQPLAGRVVSVSATGADGKPVPIADDGGRLTPTVLVAPGEQMHVDVVVRRPKWVGWVAGRTAHEQ
ncbi:MAG TPA: hypothetical protein VMH47_03770, partial [Gaiellaceae bacterium]|nr:hypothetical protein [Gaiellaceae bacterium]